MSPSVVPGRSRFDIRDQMPGAAGMLGAAANVVMQLGNPGVGYGVVESTVDSGNVLIHPWKRLRTTLSYLVVALFGSDEDVDRYRRAVNRSHVPVHSGPDSPVPYNAFDPELQLWVAACLYVGFRDGRTLFLGPMDDATHRWSSLSKPPPPPLVEPVETTPTTAGRACRNHPGHRWSSLSKPPRPPLVEPVETTPAPLR